MDIKKSIEYAQVALDRLIKKNKKTNRKITPLQLGETMWLCYYLYNDNEINEKATEIINKLELNI